MLSKNKTIGLYVAVFICMISAILGIYSCNVDDYQYINESETAENEITPFSKTRNSGNVLIDSVANSDEFYEFEICSEQLADKFSAYTSKLSHEEYDKLMENLNDDEYMEDFIKKANLEKELQQMDEAKKGLLEYTVFLKLSEDERLSLFGQYAENRKLVKRNILKTRKEGTGNSKCEDLRQVAYAQAEKDYKNAIATNCRNAGPLSLCYMKEAAIYNANKKIADRKYEDCINNR